MTKLQHDILNILRNDGSVSKEEIAKTLGKTPEEIKKELRDMTDKGIIVKYIAVVNDEKADEDTVEALVEVKISSEKSTQFDKIAAKICKFPEVKDVFLMSGSYDLSVAVVGKSLREVSRFVQENLAQVDTVISTATHFILKCYKMSGVTIYPTKK